MNLQKNQNRAREKKEKTGQKRKSGGHIKEEEEDDEKSAEEKRRALSQRISPLTSEYPLPLTDLLRHSFRE